MLIILIYISNCGKWKSKTLFREKVNSKIIKLCKLRSLPDEIIEDNSLHLVS